MIPHSPPGIDVGKDKYYYLVERPGLDITDLGGIREVLDPELL